MSSVKHNVFETQDGPSWRFSREPVSNNNIHNGSYNGNVNNNINKLDKKNKLYSNRKKLLCVNVLKCGECDYGSKCMYAHSRDEQQIDEHRKRAYDILNSTSDLSGINFQENIQLYKTLKDLTRICDKDLCTGGYNCKHGVCVNKKYHVCLKDIEHGDCTDNECNKIHLTNRGLKPYYKHNKMNNANNVNNDISGIIITPDYFNRMGDVFGCSHISKSKSSDSIASSQNVNNVFQHKTMPKNILDNSPNINELTKLNILNDATALNELLNDSDDISIISDTTVSSNDNLNDDISECDESIFH